MRRTSYETSLIPGSLSFANIASGQETIDARAVAGHSPREYVHVVRTGLQRFDSPCRPVGPRMPAKLVPSENIVSGWIFCSAV